MLKVKNPPLYVKMEPPGREIFAIFFFKIVTRIELKVRNDQMRCIFVFDP